MLHVVLVEPEIPANTGNIARTCAATGSVLHLIRPLGFDISEKAVRRAGLDYWHLVDVRVYDNLEEFFRINQVEQMWCLSTKAPRAHTEAVFQDGCYLFFGKETRGLPEDFLARHEASCLRIPMLEREGLSPATTQGPLSDPADPDAVSLNLSNAANIVLFEALRQLGFPGVI